MRESLHRPIAYGLVAVGLTATVSAPVSAATAAGTRGYALERVLDYFTGNTAVVRWAPCLQGSGGPTDNVIRYKINPAGQPARVKVVRRAVAKVHRATGLTFRYAGRTSYVPQATSQGLAARAQRNASGSRFVVAWAREGSGAGSSNLLVPGLEAGVGAVRWQSGTTTQLRITDAAVVLKRGVNLRSGFGPGVSLGNLLLHELGHAVGLQHVALPTQIMNPQLSKQTPAGYASGDKAGLRKVGREGGCMQGATPPPPA